MKRAKQSLSHYKLLTCNMGELVPVGAVEVLPGDSFRHSTAMLARVATLVAPLMHPVNVRIHHWFVPNRLLWADWDEFITGKNTGVTVPTITYATNAANYKLMDHLGLPDHNGLVFNALPIRAYNMIYNEFYRDQDLNTARTTDQLGLASVCWEKDYFTTARTYPQFGATSVSIPFSAGTAPVKGIGAIGSPTLNINGTARETGTLPSRNYANYGASFGNQGIAVEVDSGVAASAKPMVYADLSQATGGVDINDLRQAFGMQRFLEARNKYGSRYTDYLRYLGVRYSDARLDQPEYLGGGKQTIAFSEVLATAESATVKVGDMAGHGIAALRTRPYRRFFEEHGYVLSLMSVRPKSMYVDSMHRGWLRSTKDDFWQKEYELFGPQAITTKEIYGKHANTTDIFGYQSRFDEYRGHPSLVAGDFRTSIANFWHMGRIFGASPALNASFVTADPTNRIYAATNEAQLYCMVNHNLAARRLVAHSAR